MRITGDLNATRTALRSPSGAIPVMVETAHKCRVCKKVIKKDAYAVFAWNPKRAGVIHSGERLPDVPDAPQTIVPVVDPLPKGKKPAKPLVGWDGRVYG